jgi:hypothetical protein
MLALLATAMAVIGLGVLPSLASAATPEAVTPSLEAGFNSLSPAAQARVASECPGSYICFWTGESYGQSGCEKGETCFSAFHGYEVGEHALANINPRSMYNHTGEHYAWFQPCIPAFPCEYSVNPGQLWQFGGRWTSGFRIS